ncbi:FtsW/RodA/SpoVE family cell cycle protein [Feifania hominis]|uniref:Rod shape-determining protein RodA n=1 Tax=Feifania hominis TaxID=2763660 RepID=A0A926DDW3_9FIRM|nr:FtsW/RodA/SpoVE family cell cycle protein [Feifania hominis]MBC8535230.1 rod shape-determining protein RodA [Feifania hominis]
MNPILKATRKYLHEIDLFLVGLCLSCTAYGLLLVASATSTFSTNRNIMVQSIGAGIGIVMMIVISLFDYETLCDLWKFFLALSIAVMAFTLVFGTGPKGQTNKNWIDLKVIMVQPAEFVKLSFIVSFAACIERLKQNLNSVKALLLLGIHAAVVIGMVLLTGDTGTVIVFCFIAFFMLFAAGLSWKIQAAGLLTAVVATPFVWQYALKPYMRNRILFAFNPEGDPSGIGFQAVQSKIAIGSGQITGKGLFQGTQVNNVPEKQTDFIFAVAGEELGFVGSVLVVLLLAAVMLRILHHARTARTDEGCLICVGVFAMFFIQVFENIGMCIGLLPVIGITLPFFSYGGSSILSVYCSIGLVLSVVRKRKSSSLDYLGD